MKLKNTLTSLAVAATTLTSCSVADPFDFSEIYIREAVNIKEKCIKEKSEYLLKCLQGNDDKDYKGLIEKADSNLKEAEFDYGVVEGSKSTQKIMPWLLDDKKQGIISAKKDLHDLRSELILKEKQINVDTLRSDIENCEGIHKLINHYGKDEVYNRISNFFDCVTNCPRNYGYELNERGEYVLINKEQFKKKLSECFPEYKENNRNRTLYEIGDILIGFLTGYFIKLFKKEENQKNNNYE